MENCAILYDTVLLGLLAPGFDLHKSKLQLLAEVRELHPKFAFDLVQVTRNSNWSFEQCNAYKNQTKIYSNAIMVKNGQVCGVNQVISSM